MGRQVYVPAPGMRIHGSYDTATDLQCDLIGITVGGLMAYVILKRQRVAVQVAALGEGSGGGE